MPNRKILALWSTPRSRSTAFLWMIRQRGDFVVLHEPFGRSAYNSEERIFNRMANILPQAEHNYQNVLQRLLKVQEESQLFIKEFPYTFQHIVDDEFLTLFQHTFLVRHPRQVLPSYYNKMPDLTFEECGYEALLGMFNKVVELTGQIPVVINADDLISSSEDIVQKYCSKVGIPFVEKALNWDPPGDTNEIGWWDGTSWVDDMRSSKGFQNTEKPHYLKIHENKELQSLYDQCLPLYEKLNEHRL